MKTIAPIIPFSWAFLTLIPRKGPPYFVRAILPLRLIPRAFSRLKSACWPRPGFVLGGFGCLFWGTYRRRHIPLMHCQRMNIHEKLALDWDNYRELAILSKTDCGLVGVLFV